MTCSLQDGKTALHLATEKGHTDVVDILVKHDASMHVDAMCMVSDLCHVLCASLYNYNMNIN